MTTASDDQAISSPAARTGSKLAGSNLTGRNLTGRKLTGSKLAGGKLAGRKLTGGKLDGWAPEDPLFWRRTGARVALRNLAFSILSEHIGFSVWSLWSVLVLFLTPAYGISHDLKTAAAEKFLLTTLPTVVGSVLRIPYTLAVARLGGRTWTCVSAALLLAPTLAAAVVLTPGVSYDTLLLVAALAGVGGGNFASSMANINSFYPQRLTVRTLSLSAGGGNIGSADNALGQGGSTGSAGQRVLDPAAHPDGHPRGAGEPEAGIRDLRRQLGCVAGA